MNLEYFNSFIETVNQKSLSKASERLNLSQPALGKQIRNLEDYFGTELFIRTASGVEVTDAGELVYKRLPLILAELKLLKEDVRQLTGGRTYSLGTLPSLAGNYVPINLQKFKSKGLEIDVSVRNTSEEVVELLKKREIDFAIIEKMPSSSNFWQKDLFKEPFYAIVPNNHKLANETSIHIEELSEEEFVLYPSNCQIRQSIHHFLKNIKIKTEVEFGGFLIGYVAAQAGITIVPENTAKYIGHPLVKSIPICTPNLNRTISLISYSQAPGKLLYSILKGE